MKAPYIIYADFESIIESLPRDTRDPTERTEKTLKHKACGFAYTIVCSNGKSWSRKYRQGADGETPAAQEFLKAIQEEEQRIREELEKPAPLKMGHHDWHNFKIAENCWICKENLWKENFLDLVPVRYDKTGAYCRQSHRKCCWESTCITIIEEDENRWVLKK